MTDPKASTANDSARCHGNAGLKVADCKFCMRQGLPILPVRYAVSLIEDTPDVTPLPADREAELYPLDKDGNPVPIKLDTVYEKDDQGNFQKKSGLKKVSKYILRIMRSGFLYVYDEGNAAWYAYAITDTGEFEQFSIADTDKQYKKKSQKFACDKKGTRASAKLITLDRVDTTKKAWFMYIESPISREFLRDVASTAEWREKNMQCFDVDAWLNSGKADYAFSQDEIEKFLTDYGKSKSQLNNCYHSFKLKGDETSLGDIQTAINSRIDNNSFLKEKVGKGVMVAVKDETAIIEELNSYRQRPYKSLDQFLKQEDNARKYQSATAINHLRKAIKDSFSNENSRLETLESRGLEVYQIAFNIETSMRFDTKKYFPTSSQIEQVVKASEGNDPIFVKVILNHVDIPYAIDFYKNKEPKLSSALDKIRQDNPDTYRGHRISRLSLNYINSLPSEISKGDERREEKQRNYTNEFDKYYDRTTVDKFINEKIKPYKDCIEKEVPRRDGDYSAWVYGGISSSINRYDNIKPRFGVKVTEIIKSVLEFNILSDSSQWLWGHLLDNLSSKNSIIVKANFSNVRKTVENYLAQVASLESKGDKFFSVSTISKFWKISKTLYKVGNNLDKDCWGITELQDFKKYLLKLDKVLTGGSSALMAIEKTDNIHKKGEYIPNTKRFVNLVRVFQISNVIVNSDGVEFQTKKIAIHEIDGVTVGEYHHYIRYMTNYNGAEVLREDNYFVNKDHEGRSVAITGNRPMFTISDSDMPAKVYYQMDNASVEYHSESIKEYSIGEELPEKIRVSNSDIVDGEFKEHHNRIWNTPDLIGVIDVILSFLSLADTWKKYSKEKDKDGFFNGQLFSLFSDSVGLVGALFSVADTITEPRGLTSVGESKLANSLASNSAREAAAAGSGGVIKAGSKIFGVGGNILGVIGGFQTLAEAETLQRKGAMKSQVIGTKVLGGVAIVGGLAALACGSLVLIPFAIAIISLIIVFKLIQLVDHNIRTWLRRSRFGFESDTVMGGKFKNSSDEINSLNMVFSGIDVVILKDIKRGTKWLEYFSMGFDYLSKSTGNILAGNGHKIYNVIYGDNAVNLKVSIPKKTKGIIKLDLNYDLQDKSFKRNIFYINPNKEEIEVETISDSAFRNFEQINNKTVVLKKYVGKDDNDPRLNVDNNVVTFELYMNTESKVLNGLLRIILLSTNKNLSKDTISISDLKEKTNDVYKF